jgi:serine/threonine protein kinase
VKLLDFGPAKMRTAEAVAGMTVLPTQTTPLTREGTILGTLQHMTPEQLEGLEADARTDIFALDAVIYEMATGRKELPTSADSRVAEHIGFHPCCASRTPDTAAPSSPARSQCDVSGASIMLTGSNEHRSINYFQAELDLALYRIGAGDGTEVLVPE